MEWMDFVSIVAIPAFGGLLVLHIQHRRDADGRFAQHQAATISVAAELAAYKVEVAQRYVSTNYLRDVETRLTDHLAKIETKLDRVIESRGEKA